MTKKLEEFFNMDSAAEVEAETIPKAEIIPMPDTIERVKDQITVANRINEALPQVRGLEVEDRDLDEYANKAMDSYERLMDLGFNVDDRNAGKIFEVASTMMGNAITAKTTKLEKKLKMVELQLRLARLQKDLGKDEEAEKPTELNTDRNAILNIINQNMKKT